MITQIARSPAKDLREVADLISRHPAYFSATFPSCSNAKELIATLKESVQKWSVLSADRPAAFFRLRLFGSDAVVDKFLPFSVLPFDVLVLNLKTDFARMKVTFLKMRVEEETVGAFLSSGFHRIGVEARMSGSIAEAKLMQLLPLVNPVKDDIPTLAKLMSESYAKSSEKEAPSPTVADKLLRDIMDGGLGPYVEAASFMSGTRENTVSACLVTLNSPEEANLAELFTHPLYRARGLATAEIVMSMNNLAKSNVRRMTVWLDEANDVARRLFAKLGFKQDGKLVDVKCNIP